MKQNIFVYTSLLMVSFCLIFLVYLISICLSKGFELSDESYYLLASKYPYDNILLNSSFGLVNYKFCFGNTDLYSLRLFKFMYQLMFLGAFSYAFYRYVSINTGIHKRVILLLSLVLVACGLSNYDYLPMTLSYNSWSLNLSLLFWAGVLFLETTEGRVGIAISTSLIGLSVALLFYIKTPNSIVITLVFLIYTLLFNKKRTIEKLLFFLLGILLGLLILFPTIDVFKSLTGNLLNAISQVKNTNVGNYFIQIKELLFTNLGMMFLIMELALLIAMYILRKKGFPLLIGLALIIANSYFAFSYIKGNSVEISYEFRVLIVFVVNSLAALILFYAKSEFKRSDLFIPVLLFLSPFLLAAGTSNSIFYTASHFMVFIVSAAFLLLLKNGDNRMVYFYGFSSLFISLCIVSFLYNGMILNPYRQTNLLNKSTYLPNSQQIIGIQESDERANKFKELSGKLKRYNLEKRNVLASPPALGALVLTDMKPFAVCWIADPEEMAEVNDGYFKKCDFRINKPFLLISSQIKRGVHQNEIFKKHGLDLKKDYKLMDSVYLDLNKEYYYFMKP